MKENRVIFHLDMDAFFASIEIMLDPSLKGKAVIVGGQPDKRGVVSTCSYEARVFGVRSAMPLSEAKRKCPHGIFLDGHYSLYREYSDKVMALLYQFTPIVQIVSIDEAYLDVTATAKDFSSPKELAQQIKRAIFDKTALPCSVGIAGNKMVAKIASGLAKPNGIYEVPAGEEDQYLAKLPIQALPGVGEKTQERLNDEGIKLIGDLQPFTLDEMMNQYGSWGYHLYQAVHGIDKREVETEDAAPKSIGAETTFETDLAERPLIEEALVELVEKSWKRLKRHHMHTGALCLKLRDSHFRTITRHRQLFCDTDNLEEIQKEAKLLFESSYTEETPLRLIGISLQKLTEDYWQPALWTW